MLRFVSFLVVAATVCVTRVDVAYPERVLLRDVDVITLHKGKQTNARRSNPVPQLTCVGGTAGCSSFQPRVVQCYNRGSDGNDIQWECKTDMDQAYRFGELEVSCEGYDYPDDPYVLKGSCGLEYMLDLSNVENQQHKQYDDQSRRNVYHRSQTHSGFSVGTLVVLGIICFVIYKAYKWISSQHEVNSHNQQPGSFSSPPPPPPGFRPEYMPGGGNFCSSTAYPGQGAQMPSSHGHTGGGGFWTGAATGGFLGYLFGSRNNNVYQQPTNFSPRYGASGLGTDWGSAGFGGSSSNCRNSASSDTRTVSGFGGTKRR